MYSSTIPLMRTFKTTLVLSGLSFQHVVKSEGSGVGAAPQEKAVRSLKWQKSGCPFLAHVKHNMVLDEMIKKPSVCSDERLG